MRTKMGRTALCLAGFAMLLLFQNFTYDKSHDARDAIFGKGGIRSALKAPLKSDEQGVTAQRASAAPGASAEMRGLALQASAYADFIGVEDVGRMTDAEILSRVSDSMFTSVEVMKMEKNTRDGKVKTVESIARALEKDSKLQRMVIAAVRENASKLQ